MITWREKLLLCVFCLDKCRITVTEISLQNMRNSENIGHILLGTVR